MNARLASGSESSDMSYTPSSTASSTYSDLFENGYLPDIFLETLFDQRQVNVTGTGFCHGKSLKYISVLLKLTIESINQLHLSEQRQMNLATHLRTQRLFKLLKILINCAAEKTKRVDHPSQHFLKLFTNFGTNLIDIFGNINSEYNNEDSGLLHHAKTLPVQIDRVEMAKEIVLFYWYKTNIWFKRAKLMFKERLDQINQIRSDFDLYSPDATESLGEFIKDIRDKETSASQAEFNIEIADLQKQKLQLLNDLNNLIETLKLRSQLLNNLSDHNNSLDADTNINNKNNAYSIIYQDLDEAIESIIGESSESNTPVSMLDTKKVPLEIASQPPYPNNDESKPKKRRKSFGGKRRHKKTQRRRRNSRIKSMKPKKRQNRRKTKSTHKKRGTKKH